MPLQLLSVPAGHAYVRHLLPRGPAAAQVRLRPDVLRWESPGGGDGVWWPPRALEPHWLAARVHEVDVVHVHFGFESRTPAQLQEFAGVLDAAAVPLVVTVHDLHNPHMQDNTAHEAQLAELLRHAAAVLTLTPGAARQIAARFGRTAEVVEHPHLVPLDRIAADPPARRSGAAVIGLELGALRSNVDGAAVVAVAAAVAVLPSAELRVGVRPGAVDTPLGQELSRRAARGELELVVTPRCSDAELWDRIQGYDVMVLPYLHGTHSGWLEACWDLGVAVVIPALGCYAEQHPGAASYREPTRAGLGAALRTALTAAPGTRAEPGTRARERAAQRDRIAATHAGVYARVLAGTAWQQREAG